MNDDHQNLPGYVLRRSFGVIERLACFVIGATWLLSVGVTLYEKYQFELPLGSEIVWTVSNLISITVGLTGMYWIYAALDRMKAEPQFFGIGKATSIIFSALVIAGNHFYHDNATSSHEFVQSLNDDLAIGFLLTTSCYWACDWMQERDVSKNGIRMEFDWRDIYTDESKIGQFLSILTIFMLNVYRFILEMLAVSWRMPALSGLKVLLCIGVFLVWRAAVSERRHSPRQP